MNNTKWLQGLHHTDTARPTTPVEGEQMYTLFMRDFLKMPDMDFRSLVMVDASVRTLLN